MDSLRTDFELVGDSHALRMGNVLHKRPYTKRREGLAISGCTTKQLLRNIINNPPNKPVILVIGCNDILQAFQAPLCQRKKEFKLRKASLFALLKQMMQYECLVLEVFPIPRLEMTHGVIARLYLGIWNLIINKFDGLGGIKVIHTEQLFSCSDDNIKCWLYEKYIGPQRAHDMIHLNHSGYQTILCELAGLLDSDDECTNRTFVKSEELSPSSEKYINGT